VEIVTPTGTTGWVNAHYLTEVVDAAVFCSDPRVTNLINAFVSAVQSQDGAALAQLVSPTHGLTIRHNWWNPEVNLQGQSVLADLFTDTTSHDWGVQDGSGLPIQGPFKDEILPLLQDVFNGSYTQHCNDLANGSGGTAGMVVWPFEYQNINYVALYRAGAPGDELNWRTWAIGVEFVKGQPYIAFLVQYHWEI